MMLYGDEFIFLLVIYLVCRWQAHRFDVEQKKIKHWFWACLFGAVITAAWYFLSRQNYYFAGALTLEHAVLFGPILNRLRKPKREWFYIHSEDDRGSWFDKIMLCLNSKFYRAWPFIWAACAIGFIILQFFL